MRKNYTHLIIILDKSGSMSSQAGDTIGGVNRLVAEQKALPGGFTASLYQFNESLEEVQNFTELNTANYQPAGATALIDAACQVIDREGAELATLPEKNRPDKVVVLIVTDGYENASKKFKKVDLQERRRIQADIYKWQFVFLGANIDAFAEASSYGISTRNAYQFTMDSAGIKTSYSVASSALSNYRAGATADVDLTQQTK